MTDRLPSLRSFIFRGIALIAAVFGIWLFVDRVWFGHLLPDARQSFCMTKGLGASFLILLVATLAMRRRMRVVEATEAKYRSILESAPTAIVIIDSNGRIVLASALAEPLFGCPRAALRGRSIEDFLQQEQRAGCFDNSLGDFRNSSTQSVADGPDLMLRRLDGTRVPVEVSFSPLETTDGFLSVGMINDITERKTQERRRTARHAVRRILADAPTLTSAFPLALQAVCESLRFDAAVIWLADAQGQALTCAQSWTDPARPNPVFLAVCQGRTVAAGEGLAGRVWADGRPLGVADGADGEVRGAVAAPIPVGSEVLGIVECFTREPLALDDGLLETLASIGSQLGRYLQHKRTEEAVRESEARKAAIVESALDGIITIDHTGKIIEFNPAAERMFGCSRAEALGREMAGLIVPPALRERCRQGLARCLAGGEGPALGRRLELTALRANGSEFPVELAVTPIRGLGAPMFTAYIRDLTERRHTEAALRQAEERFMQTQKMEAIGRLAGGVAHDFNNLLTVINGYAAFLLRTLAEDNPARGPVADMLTAGERAATLTRQLLAFSRKQVLEPKVFDLNQTVTVMSQMLRRLIGEDIAFTAALAENLRPIKADPGKIEQVLMNLVVNARDAMPDGGKLVIETANVELDATYALTHPEVRPGPYVVLAVTDTGCGMDEATQARIFEPFFTTRGPGKGTGLGLSTVYGIVKQSGGHITVYSEQGIGTTFKVYLPAVTEAVPALPPPLPAAEVPAQSGTVLLVEDEDSVRTLTRQILQTNGFTVLEARHGQEALQLYEHEIDSVQLTVTDVVMPEMNGRDLAQHLLRRQPHMKVLYLSGYTDNAIFRNGLLEPGTAFLEKPFTPDTLVRKVHEVMNG